MKNSNPTNNNLNKVTVDINQPHQWKERIKKWFACIITLGLFFVLVKLGFWQLERGIEKRNLETQFSQRETEDYQPLSTLIKQNDWRWEQILGKRVSADITPSNEAIILLDNQVHQGEVGYLAFQLVQYKDVHLLMELGFVEAGYDRSQFPDVVRLQQPQAITGRVYFKQKNWVSDELMLEPGTTHRIQNLNLTALAEVYGVTLLPIVLQPDNLIQWPQPFPWHPIALQSEKHFGYAVQWFAMAAFLALCVTIFVSRTRSKLDDLRLKRRGNGT